VAELVNGGDAAWREAAREELSQLLDDMLHTEKTHMAAAERLQNLHNLLGVAATMLAAAATATIVATLSKVVTGLLALAAAIASGVLTFTKPERAAERHLAAGRQLAALRVHARQVLHLDLPVQDREALRAAIDEIATRKAALDEAAPGTRGRDYAVARDKITRGVFDRDR
jgi:conflict system pore-forming effector with SLATT domain